MKNVFKIGMILLSLSFFTCEKTDVSNEDSLNNELRFSNDLNQFLDIKKDCETAFAYDSNALCFRDDDDLNSNRWGWSIGPLSDSHSGSYDIYQGAGKCNINNGSLVGTLDITYSDGTVTVDFIANEGFGFFETHLFIGDEKYPRKQNGQFTVAPGQYGNGNSFPDGTSSDSFTFENINGEIYIIAHAEVCPFEEVCKADAGLIKADASKYCYNENGPTVISATPDGGAFAPEGYQILYVLTEGPELVIIDVNDAPSFEVTNVGNFTIHTLIYDPNTLDLEIVMIGITTGGQVLSYILENEICADLDVKGAPTLVEKCS